MSGAYDTPEALQRLMGARFPLSEQQFAAATAPLEPAVVVAGAGSGKTTLMAARVVWLVASGHVAPAEVLGLTFTTKAAAELATRIREALAGAGILPPPGTRHPVDPGEPEEPDEPTVATYNAYAAGLLTDHGLRIGHEPDARVVADAGRYQLAARVIAGHRGTVQHLGDHPPTVAAALLALDAAMSEHLVTPAEVRAWQRAQRPAFEAALAAEPLKTRRALLAGLLDAFDRRSELLDLVEDYRRLKGRLRLVQFSDQIELGARLAETRPEVGQLERSRFKVVLLDEYQDTSVAQARMLGALFSGPDAGSGRGHPVTAVGDPHQAIYGWRGASVSNILRFGERFPAGDGSTRVPSYQLTVNRRSDRRILDVANALAAPLQTAGDGTAPPVAALQAKPEAAPGDVRAEVFETWRGELDWLPDQVRAAARRHGGWREVGVLTRDNAGAAAVHDVLSSAGIPVEIVGLTGLLELPEVREVVATLTLLQDLTANAALLTVLSGPRWAIGPRDLAVLGRRAETLAGGGPPRRPGAGDRPPLDRALDEAVAVADPSEQPSLCEALEDPGDPESFAYSMEARERFGLLAGELRRLRRHVGEPLSDLVRRIVDTLGLDVELASSTDPAAAARRDNLDLFLQAVADFQAVDGAVDLTALLAYLEAEEEAGAGLDVATPTPADSVKLLTVHRAKGLEWDAVFVVGVARHRFPTTQGRAKWTASPGVLPFPLRGDAGDLPRLVGTDAQALQRLPLDCKEHEQREERRLGYVAFTRARHELVVTSHVWGPTRATPCGPSDYQQVVRDVLEDLARQGGLDPAGLPVWPDVPERGAATNPLLDAVPAVPWPVAVTGPEVDRRRAGAALVHRELAGPTASDPAGLTEEEQDRVAGWDCDLERLLAEELERGGAVVEVPLPSSLPATLLAQLGEDPAAVAERLARPMPRRPSPAARFGTRFHAWVEARFRGRQELLVDLDELAGRADAEVAGEADLAELVERFEKGVFGDRLEAFVEVPFALVLAGQVVRGRIDAVFPEPDGTFLVVDWKTHRARTADPLQLAVYRLAWSELASVPVDRVRAAFHYVRDDHLEEHAALPGRAELERLLRG